MMYNLKTKNLRGILEMKSTTRKIIAMLSAVALVVGLVGCGNATPTASSDTTVAASTAAVETDKATETQKVAFLPGDMANESQAFAAKQFEKFAKDYGFEVTILDGKGDAQVQAQVVNNAVAQGLKAIFVNPNDVNAIAPSLAQAKAAGVVVAMFSSDLAKENAASRDFFVGVNDNQAGEAAAKAFKDKFPDGANIVEIGGQAGHDAQIKRHDGFNNAIKDSKIKVINYQATQTWSTSEAMAIMEDMIVKDGDKIQGVFCHWDNGATGVIEALKAANKMNNMFIVGVDGCKAGFDQVNKGEQSVTIMQNFETITKKSLELARKVIDGGKVDAENFVPLDIVSKDNINNFTAPEW